MAEVLGICCDVTALSSVALLVATFPGFWGKKYADDSG